MKPFLINLTATLAFVGCGGAPEANAPSKQTSTNPSPSSVASESIPPEAKSAMVSPPPSSKKAAEAPGLVLPDDDADVVGGKGPELPIR